MNEDEAKKLIKDAIEKTSNPKLTNENLLKAINKLAGSWATKPKKEETNDERTG